MLKLFFSATPVNSLSLSITALALRLMAGGAMLSHGIPKLLSFTVLSKTFPDPLGVGSLFSLSMAIGAEVGCSLLLIAGLFTRLALLPLFFTMLMAFFVIHASDLFAVKELAMMYMMVYLAIFSIGSGRFSLDRLITKREKHNI